MAARLAYGTNPHMTVNPNEDHGWGNYQWPQGVPDNLLDTATYTAKDKDGNIVSTASGELRKELVPLAEKMWELAWVKYGYAVYGNPVPAGYNDFSWGPWCYQNRPIGGTVSPSNHSKAKAFDCNAPWNPQSHQFVTNMPSGLVHDWESLGWYWGGRYNGITTKFDTMHWEFILTPADVAGMIAKVEAMLAALAPKPVEDDDMSPKDWTSDDWTAFNKNVDSRIAFALDNKLYPCVDIAATQPDGTNNVKYSISQMLQRGAIRLMSLTAVGTKSVQDHTVKPSK